MKHYSTSLLLIAIIQTSLGAAELPDGDEIARRINARDEGQAVSRYVTMELTDRSGKQRIRETKGFRKYYGAEKRTVIFYLAPKNIKGTAFLTYDYAETDKDDDPDRSIRWRYCRQP